MAKDILHHDDGGIDDDAEVDRADRQQIGGFSAQHRDDDREKQCCRNSRRHDQCGAQIAQKHPLDDKEQHHAEQHIVKDGPHGDRNKVAAVVEGFDAHTGRQRAVGVHSCHRLSYTLHHVHRALELLHQYDAGHYAGRVLAPGDAKPRCEADLHFGDIGDQYRLAALLGQYDTADIFERPHNTEATNIDRLLAHRDRSAANIGIVGGDRVDDLRYRNAECPHAIEGDLGLKLLGLAAEHEYVGRSRHHAQPALHHPVLQRLEFNQVHIGRPFELVAEALADGAGRGDHWLHALRQVGLPQAIYCLLAYEVVVAAVFELKPNETERVDRVGTDVSEPRRTGDRGLDWDRDVTFHLRGRLACPLRDDLDDRGRGIGIGLDVECGEGHKAQAEKRRERDQYERAPQQAESNQATQHST